MSSRAWKRPVARIARNELFSDGSNYVRCSHCGGITREASAFGTICGKCRSGMFSEEMHNFFKLSSVDGIQIEYPVESSLVNEENDRWLGAEASMEASDDNLERMIERILID